MGPSYTQLSIRVSYNSLFQSQKLYKEVYVRNCFYRSFRDGQHPFVAP